MAIGDPFPGLGIAPIYQQDMDAMHKAILDQLHLPPELFNTTHNMQAAQQSAFHNGMEQKPKLNLHARARGMLIQRLGGVASEFNVNENDFLMCHVVAGTVYVFFLLNHREGVTTESMDIFPSDKLVAQLRMVMMA